MTPTEKFFMYAAGKAALGEASSEIPPDVDQDELLRLATVNGMTYLLACAVKGAKGLNPDIAKKLEAHQAGMVIYGVNLEYEGNKIFSALEDSGLDYAPLKGWVNRDLYADPLMRTMGDIDILIRREQWEHARNVLEGCGFRYEKYESTHACFFNDSGLEIEMHDCILGCASMYGPVYFDSWKFFNKSCETRHLYEMDVVEQYIYTLLHFEKHLFICAARLFPFFDLYLMEKRYGLDPHEGKLNARLNELGILPLALNVYDLSRYWFESRTLSFAVTEYADLLIHFMDESWEAMKRWSGACVPGHYEIALPKPLNVIFPYYENIPYLQPRLRFCRFFPLPMVWIVFFFRWNTRCLKAFLCRTKSRLAGEKEAKIWEKLEKFRLCRIDSGDTEITR